MNDSERTACLSRVCESGRKLAEWSKKADSVRTSLAHGRTEESGESVAPYLLHFLLSDSLEEESRPQSKDIQIFSRAASSLVEATEEGILTEAEASVVIEFLVSRFASRRLDRVLRHLSSPEEESWFVAASRATAYNR